MLLLALLLVGKAASSADGGRAGLAWSAGWGVEWGKGGHGWTNLMFDQNNLTIIEEAFAGGGVKSLYKWEGYATRRATAIPGTNDCASPIHRFGNTTGCVTLSPTWHRQWAAVHATLKPHIASGAVVGLMLGDERMWDGVSMANLTVLTDTIKADWPEAILFINEAQDVILCGFNRLNESLFTVDGPQCWPKNLDWVGFDLYDMTVSNGGTAFSQFNVSKRGDI